MRFVRNACFSESLFFAIIPAHLNFGFLCIKGSWDGPNFYFVKIEKYWGLDPVRSLTGS